MPLSIVLMKPNSSGKLSLREVILRAKRRSRPCDWSNPFAKLCLLVVIFSIWKS